MVRIGFIRNCAIALKIFNRVCEIPAGAQRDFCYSEVACQSDEQELVRDFCNRNPQDRRIGVTYPGGSEPENLYDVKEFNFPHYSKHAMPERHMQGIESGE